jgi:hypothetical protein
MSRRIVRQVLLDAFQGPRLSGSEFPNESVVDSEGRYQGLPCAALAKIDSPTRDRVIAVLQMLGGVSCSTQSAGP